MFNFLIDPSRYDYNRYDYTLENATVDFPNFVYGLCNIINLERRNLKNIHPEAFNKTYAVLEISLAFNELEHLNSSLFQNNLDLRELNLSHNKLRYFDVKNLLRLEKLILDNNHIESISIKILDYPELKELSINNNKIKSVDNKFINIIRRFEYRELEVSFENTTCYINNNSWLKTPVNISSAECNRTQLESVFNKYIKQSTVHRRCNKFIIYNYYVV
jgi:Leucine-rich repeat (LRR) protein